MSEPRTPDDPDATPSGDGDDPATASGDRNDPATASEPGGPGGLPDPDDGRVHEGWWRYPPAAWIGLVTLPAGAAVVGLAAGRDPGVATQFLLFVGTALLAGPVLALVLGSLLSVGTVFWGSRRYRDDPDVDWEPSPVVYLVAAFPFTPLLVGGVWFLQRVRHVGRPDLSTWI